MVCCFPGTRFFTAARDERIFRAAAAYKCRNRSGAWGSLRETTAYIPGHGGGSTLDEERRYNPYLGAAL